MASSQFDLNNGAFFIPCRGSTLRVIASDGLCNDLTPEEKERYAGWEHVSVSLPNRTPTWEEMCYVKNLFWDEEDCVIQYHPPKEVYVTCHPFCLHLWRWRHGVFPMPDPLLVGPKD
jgi:hypothetical protein